MNDTLSPEETREEERIISSSTDDRDYQGIKKVFRLTLDLALSSEKEPDLKEIDDLYERINNFYADFLERNKGSILSFFFDLNVNEELSEIKLEVSLSTRHFYPIKFLVPPYPDFQGDADQPESGDKRHKKRKHKIQIRVTSVQNPGGGNTGGPLT
jgi:hypothetical protein